MKKMALAVTGIIGVLLVCFLCVKRNEAAQLKEAAQKKQVEEKKTEKEAQFGKEILKEIYLYQSGDVKKYTKKDDAYDKLTDEIMHVINNPSAFEDTIDSCMEFCGRGTPMAKKTKDRYLEVIFEEPITMTYLGREWFDISRIVMVPDEDIVYIYKENSAEKDMSFAGFACEDTAIHTIASIIEG